jgi:putative spermidine/putrescine transport system permease protein
MTTWPERIGALVLRAVVIAVLVFLLAPLLIVIIVSFGEAAFIQFPPQTLSLKWYVNIARLDGFVGSLMLSLQLAVVTTCVTTLLGISASLALTRYNFRGRQALMSLFLSPLILPAIVIGIGMLQYFRAIDLFSTFTTLLAGHVVITLPYMIRTVTSSLELQDESLVEASRVLGADTLQTFTRVIVPGIKSGLMAGALFTFIMSFDNYSVSLFLSDAVYETLPIRMLSYVERTIDPTVAAASSILIFFSIIQLILGAWLVGVRRMGGLADK